MMFNKSVFKLIFKVHAPWSGIYSNNNSSSIVKVSDSQGKRGNVKKNEMGKEDTTYQT